VAGQPFKPKYRWLSSLLWNKLRKLYPARRRPWHGNDASGCECAGRQHVLLHGSSVQRKPRKRSFERGDTLYAGRHAYTHTDSDSQTQSYAYTHTDSHSQTESYAYAHTDSHSQTESYSNAYAYANSDTNSNANPDSNSNSNTNTYAYPDSNRNAAT
jgi:hypothetical protein